MTAEKTPSTESRRFTPEKRSVKGSESACRAKARCGSGLRKLFMKKGGLHTILSNCCPTPSLPDSPAAKA